MIVTGCIDPSTLDRLNAEDPGGQYDSSGGTGGNGNPAGSVCKGCVFCGIWSLKSLVESPRRPSIVETLTPWFPTLNRYNHYVEILEPAGPRACLRCCDNAEDCPTNRGACHVSNSTQEPRFFIRLLHFQTLRGALMSFQGTTSIVYEYRRSEPRKNERTRYVHTRHPITRTRILVISFV